ncbi:LysR family transcriptional regulator [Enterococcus olivae]
MRIQQLEYLEKIVALGSMNEAAKALYMTQPSLSSAIKELENEMSIQILVRSKAGVRLTEEGREFMSYAQQVMDQVQLLEEKYKHTQPRKQTFSVSAQHYAFVVHAFVELINDLDVEEYQFKLRETETENILEDLSRFKSELGILYLNSFNEKVMMKLFKERELIFHPLFQAKPHVFVSNTSPLGQKDIVELEDLKEYPYLSYEQGERNSFYFAEEILSTVEHRKEIKVSDRATIFNLMVGVNGYTISSGVLSKKLNDDKIIAVPLNVSDQMTIGYLKHRQKELSPVAQQYLQLLGDHIRGYGFDIL